jgi:hypothetical protein
MDGRSWKFIQMFVGECHSKCLLGRFRRWKDNIKDDLRQIACEDRTQLKLADDHVCWGDLVSAMLILWVLLTICVNCRFKVFYGCFGFPLTVSCHHCLYFMFIHLFLLLKKGSKNHLDY